MKSLTCCCEKNIQPLTEGAQRKKEIKKKGEGKGRKWGRKQGKKKQSYPNFFAEKRKSRLNFGTSWNSHREEPGERTAGRREIKRGTTFLG